MQLLYKVSVIARFLNLTERRVQQLARDGIIPKAEKGKYDLVGCVQGYIAYLQARAFGKDSESIDMHAERSRLLKLQADRAQMELDVMLSKLIPAEEAEELWAGLSPRTLERWRWAGEGLRFVKIGGLVRYRLEDVEAYEASNEIPKDSDLKDETPSGGDA